MRTADIEFRQIDGQRPEIVQWFKRTAEGPEHCITLCRWSQDAEGYSVEFVGSWPFDYAHTIQLWKLMQYGQKVLDAQFELEQE